MLPKSSLDSMCHPLTPFHPLSLHTVHVVSGGDPTSEFLSGDAESVESLMSPPHEQNEEGMGGVSDAPRILGSAWASHYKKDTELPERRCRELSL